MSHYPLPLLPPIRWNTFHLEASSSCRYDYVIVYDGPNAMAPIMGQFCGTELPPNLQSTTNQMFIAFTTDSSVSGIGWRATYIETLGRSSYTWLLYLSILKQWMVLHFSYRSVPDTIWAI